MHLIFRGTDDNYNAQLERLRSCFLFLFFYFLQRNNRLINIHFKSQESILLVDRPIASITIYNEKMLIIQATPYHPILITGVTLSLSQATSLCGFLAQRIWDCIKVLYSKWRGKGSRQWILTQILIKNFPHQHTFSAPWHYILKYHRIFQIIIFLSHIYHNSEYPFLTCSGDKKKYKSSSWKCFPKKTLKYSYIFNTIGLSLVNIPLF